MPDERIEGDQPCPRRPNGIVGSVLDGINTVKHLRPDQVIVVLLFLFLAILVGGTWIGYNRIIEDMEYNRTQVREELRYARDTAAQARGSVDALTGEVRAARQSLDNLRGEVRSLRDEVRRLHKPPWWPPLPHGDNTSTDWWTGLFGRLVQGGG